MRPRSSSCLVVQRRSGRQQPVQLQPRNPQPCSQPCSQPYYAPGCGPAPDMLRRGTRPAPALPQLSQVARGTAGKGNAFGCDTGPPQLKSDDESDDDDDDDDDEYEEDRVNGMEVAMPCAVCSRNRRSVVSVGHVVLVGASLPPRGSGRAWRGALLRNYVAPPPLAPQPTTRAWLGAQWGSADTGRYLLSPLDALRSWKSSQVETLASPRDIPCTYDSTPAPSTANSMRSRSVSLQRRTILLALQRGMLGTNCRTVASNILRHFIILPARGTSGHPPGIPTLCAACRAR